MTTLCFTLEQRNLEGSRKLSLETQIGSLLEMGRETTEKNKSVLEHVVHTIHVFCDYVSVICHYKLCSAIKLATFIEQVILQFILLPVYIYI